ncbi:MAG: penicillin-binding protein 2 [Patescibacteria group bacterium]|jgi:penicillin-binding protein 2
MNLFKFKNQNHNKPDAFAVQTGRFERLNTDYRETWSDDFLIGKDQSKGTLKKNFDFGRLRFMNISLALALTLLIGRTAWLQVAKGDYYYGMAEGNRVRISRIEAKRGVIYDRNYNPLVRNVANFMLYVIPSDLSADEKEREALAGKMAEIMQVKKEDVLSIINSVDRKSFEAYQPLYIADNIPYETAIRLDLLSSGEKGVVLSSKTRREYNLYCNSMSHVLGFTGKISPEELKKYGEEYLPIDYVGKNGIEYFWESELRGRDGKKQVEVDALGKEKKILAEEKGVDGNNLVLAVDMAMQKKLEEIIANRLKGTNLKKASAIIMDPRNGEILTMISLPAYDDNVFARGITGDEYADLLSDENKPLFNRSISGEFPSGSVIKPVIAAAALEEGIVDQDATVLSNGGIRVGEWFFPDWKAGGHGVTNVRKAIAESVNTFFYYIGGGYEDFIGLGVDRIAKYGKIFGLDAQTGIDLAGEADGFMPSKEWKEEAKNERWYIGDTYHLSIGQGDLLVTPLQVAVYTSAFANNGKIYRPHLIRQVLSGTDKLKGEVVEEPVRDLINAKLVSKDTINIVREGMRQTVTAGSARSMSALPVEVAGKTGTAQWSTKKDPHAWFTGFAPYDNPELVITILIEEGKGGDLIAVPIAKEFFEWYYKEYKKIDNSKQ